MSNRNKQAGPGQPDSYARGFWMGTMFGCAPLLLIIGFVVFVIVLGAFTHSSHYQQEDRGGREDFALPPRLPQVSEEEAALQLPVPATVELAPIYLGEDLSQVPLVSLDATDAAPMQAWKVRKAHAVAVALSLNTKETDGYLRAILPTRPDLAGLPFAMGGACRTTGEKAQAFKDAANAVRNNKGAALLAEPDPDRQYSRGLHDQAHLAVVSQVAPVASSRDQQSLIRGLASISSSEATRRLAQLAVFSPEQSIRNLALEALSVRQGEPATSVLLAGLHYPWPPVAWNAAMAIVQLKRDDLIPQLEALLHAADPRAPRQETVAGRQETVAYELVRVNHLHNCLLCHAPIERHQREDFLSAEIPVPTMSLPEPHRGYGQTDSNLLVRIDVTYLRQDFSAMQQVEDWTAASWTAHQRFDYLLRRRILGPEEAEDLRQRLAVVSPYQKTAAVALRALTGKDPLGHQR